MQTQTYRTIQLQQRDAVATIVLNKPPLNILDIAMIEEDDPHLPGSVKGIGMLGTAGIQAAIANAVYHAIGRRVRRLPIRVEDISGKGPGARR